MLLGVVVGSVGIARAMSPAEALGQVGRAVTVEGFVESVMCSPRACLLSFETGWSGLVATISSADLDRFPEPKSAYERRKVRVRGVVQDRQGRPRLEITAPSNIETLDRAAGGGSRVLSAEAKEPVRSEDPAAPPRVRTQVQVSGGLSGGSNAARLSEIVRDLRQEGAAVGSGGGASELAVTGLRERVAIQSETIRTLEDELAEVNGRLQDLEARPIPAEPAEPSIEGVPRVERWVVPARRGLSDARPRTGWSIERVVREIGPPLEVSELGRDRALWVYEGGRALTVVRGRVVSSSGF